MRLLLLCLCASPFLGGCGTLGPTSDPRPVVRGPLPVTTNGAIAGTYLQFRPRGTATTPVGDLGVEIVSEYTSLFVNGRGPGTEVVIDAELWRTAFGLRTGLTPSADVAIEVPLVYAANGFADDLIEGWHALFGLSNGGREARPDNDYEVHVEKNGERIYELEPGTLQLGDVPIVLTQRIADEATTGVSLAVRAGIELPIGSESKGYGNGGLDWGGGLLAEVSEDRLTLTGAAYYVVTATPDDFERAGVDALDSVQLHGGLEMRWNDQASVLLGLRWSTPVTRDIELMEIDGNVLDLDLGWIHDLPGGSRLVLGFTEDLIAESGPDLTVFAGWRVGF